MDELPISFWRLATKLSQNKFCQIIRSRGRFGKAEHFAVLPPIVARDSQGMQVK